jgi:hypothetical protein
VSRVELLPEDVPEPPPPTAATLAALAAMTRLTALDLSRRPLAPPAVRELLAALPRLRSLALLGVQMGSEEVAGLAAGSPSPAKLLQRNPGADVPCELMPLAGTLCAS